MFRLSYKLTSALQLTLLITYMYVLNVQLTRLDDSRQRFDLQPRLANVLLIELRDEGDVDRSTSSVGHNQPLLMGNHEPNISELELYKKERKEREREGEGGREIYEQEANTAFTIKCTHLCSIEVHLR